MAFGGVSTTTFNSSGTNPSFTHNSSVLPKCAIVTCVNNIVASSGVPSAITYASLSMTRKAVAVDSAGEPGAVSVWARTSTEGAMSSGAATVAITQATTNTFQYVCMTVEAGGDITVSSTHRGTENANSSASQLSIAKAGVLRWAFGAKFSGIGAPTESTVIAGQVKVAVLDLGNQCAETTMESTAGTADITFGSAQTADDWALVAITLEEVAGGGGGGGSMHRPWRMGLTGVN